ncbi:MAG: SLC13 family permease [Dehalococcoidales bacterium]|nr:SLC13 family permease [Dehalococcoidales bacterium]
MVDFDTGEAEALGTRKQFVVYAAANVAITIGLYFLLRDTRQTIAASIFFALVIGTLMFWKFRVAIAFIGIVALLVTGTIDLQHTIEFMNLDVILFLVGMMVLVGLLRRSGFFRWALAKGLRLSNFGPTRLMLIILFLSALAAAMVDEVTSILFVAALVLDMCDFFKVNPVKYLISVVLATNIGSSWTVLGNPVGILIALRSGLTFGDFLGTALPIGVFALISLIVVVLIWQRKDLREIGERFGAASPAERAGFLSSLDRIENRGFFRGSAVLFVTVIVFLALHSHLEAVLNLQHNTLLVTASLFGAGVAMLWKRGLARELITKDVDWWTLIFFMFLFAKVGAIKYVGLSDRIGEAMFNMWGGSLPLLIVAMLWISAFLSAGLDNVLVVAAFVPMLQYLTQQAGTPVLWWALLFGATYGGNMTMVGSTGNIVCLGMLEDRTGYCITFKDWIKIGLLGSLVPMTIATVALLIFKA